MNQTILQSAYWDSGKMPTNSSPNPLLTEQLLTLNCMLGFPESYSANFGGSG